MSQYAEDDDRDVEADVQDDLDPEDDAVVEDGPIPHDEANDADVLEQATPVEGADDDYPNDLEVEPDV